MDLLILGPPATGKRFLLEVLTESPDLAGRVQFQTAPVGRLKSAARYVVTTRALSPESDRRRRASWMPSPPSIEECRVLAEAGAAQVAEHVSGTDPLVVDYRETVEDVQAVADKVADWFGVARWPVSLDVIDGDEGLT